MHTQLAAIAASGGASNIPALITAAATLAAFALGQLSSVWQQKRISRGEARKQTEAVTVELFAAVDDLQRALQLIEPRWTSRRSRSLVFGMAVFELLIGRATGEVGPAALRAVRGAADWDDRAGHAVAGELSAPAARVATALSRAMLLSDQDIVNAAVTVGERLPALAAAYSDNQLFRSRKKQAEFLAARERADAAVQEALGDLMTVARQRLHGSPPRRWQRTRPSRPSGER
ncbi:hypothetical protein [Micromonospora vulcania]|uniref:Uncharacterized protein n=1 Tax=Micromonospora vulcania TaxID=1441873 RepID=A0ABW1H608_9ACTN